MPEVIQPRRPRLERFFAGPRRTVADGVYLLPGFGNTTVVVGADGAAVVDPGLFTNGPRVVRELREITDGAVRWIVYTHGHYDHAFGTPALLEEAAGRGDEPPRVVGHVNVARRFARYQRTAGHLAQTYDMQFASWGDGGGDVVRTAQYVAPTLEYVDRVELPLGALTLDCRHGLGETDDHTWVWIPERRVIIGGDFIVSSIPNAGTPFRVQRYVLEWAEALEAMAALDPAAVISGHGGVYTDDAGEMLLTTAQALRWLEDEVVRRLNAGQWYEQIVNEIDLPAEFKRQRLSATDLRMSRLCGAFDPAPLHRMVRRQSEHALPQPAGRNRGRGRRPRRQSRRRAGAGASAARRECAGVDSTRAASHRFRHPRRTRRRRRRARAQGRVAGRARRGRAVVRGAQHPDVRRRGGTRLGGARLPARWLQAVRPPLPRSCASNNLTPSRPARDGESPERQ